MRLKVYRNTSNSEMFPCTVKDIKTSDLKEIEALSVQFGLTKVFEFDMGDKYKYSNLPSIKGQVIAQATVIGSSRKSISHMERTPYLTDCNLYLYPIKTKEYPHENYLEFKETIIPFLYTWFSQQLSKSDNERMLDMKLIIESIDQKLIVHKLPHK